ncbi:MAG: GNAT family N-acetyltransferase [Anaerolineae bacterium]|nr:GNAT family N-acetyltransferase [Anaerolineae bacterium]
MHIRTYSDTDIPTMLSVIKAAFAEYQGQLDPPSSAERKTVAIVKAELAEAQALVAEADGYLVGCVFFRPQAETIYIDRLAVLPTYRNRGIAGALLDAIEARALSAGTTALTLSVRLALKKQQAFYYKRGFAFQEYGTHPGYTAPTYMKMRKQLSL